MARNNEPERCIINHIAGGDNNLLRLYLLPMSEANVNFRLISPRKTNYSFQGYRDANGNKRILMEDDGTGKMVKRTITFENGAIQVNKEYDEDLYLHLLESPYCEGSDAQVKRGVQPVYREIDGMKMIKKRREEKERINEAKLKIQALDASQLLSYAFMKGLPASNEDEAWYHLDNLAEKSPEKISGTENIERLEVASVLMNARRKNIVEQKKDGSYYFQETYIAASLDNTISVLLDDEKTLTAIKDFVG